MEKKQILKKLLSQKNKDYTYAIAFFLIFSFFILFIIRPNLVSVFEANNKIEELHTLDTFYNTQIDKIIELQTTLEENRDNMLLLNQAIANKPEVNKILSDVDISSQEGGLVTSGITVSDINLKEKEDGDKLKSFTLNMNFNGDFQNSVSFIKKIFDQRRLKTISNLGISRDEKESSESSKLQITMMILGYFL